MKKNVLLFTTLFASTLLASCGTSKTYSVNFDTNGGGSIASISIKENSLITKPTDPSKDGYTFTNWTYNDKVWNFDTDKVTSNMTLFANYTENEYGYQVSFTCDAHATVYIYNTQDMSGDGEESSIAYSRDSETGALAHDGNGQVNFKVVVDDGYELDTVTIEESEGYSNLKIVDGVTNGRRITKITSNLTVNVTSKEEEEYGFKGTFETDSHSLIKYITTQSSEDWLDLGEDKAAYSRDSSTGDLLHNGEGQINFKVVCENGYTIDKVEVTPINNFNNLKLVSAENHIYRITKMTGDVLVKVTTKIDEGTIEAFKVNFVIEGEGKVTVYDNNSFQSVKESNVTSTYTRDKSTGEFTNIVDNAQVNFSVEVNEGCTVSVSATEGAYNKIKDASIDTGITNSYTITKVNQEITITITVSE